MNWPRLTTVGKMGVAALLLGSVGLVLPASAATPQVAAKLPEKMQQMLSEASLVHWYRQHPDQAPTFMRAMTARFGAHADQVSPASPMPGGFPLQGSLLNHDDLGLPQNEESVGRCGSGTVLEGTNDYRGLLNPSGNFTGWHLSTNGGASLAKEGLLPTASFKDGTEVPSGGDPVVAFDSACNAYMADLNFTYVQNGDTVTQYSGVGLYRSTPGQLRSCPGGDDPTCWPKRTVPVQDISSDPSNNHFLDKPWLYVGTSAGQTVVWLTYTDFAVAGDVFSTTIKAVRCDASLTTCSAPIVISDGLTDVQFSDVTVGPDGRAYVTWAQVNTDTSGQQTFVVKLRVAQPDSTTFEPERVVTTELKPIGFGGFLHADSFRVATYPKSDVKIVNGKPRVYVVWESCETRPAGVSCEYPRIRMTFSDSFGAGWSTPITLSAGGDNYFATLSANPGGANLAVAYWTSRFDPTFNSRQDLELLTVSPSGSVLKRQRLTNASNDTQADTYLGGFFIGDYIEVTAQGGQAFVGINGNYRKERFGLDPGQPVAQQDNYLLHATL